MKIRTALLRSVAVAGLLLGAASISGARAAEVGVGAWTGYYIGVGGGGAVGVGDINATGYHDSDFSSGADYNGSNFDIYASGDSYFSGDSDNRIDIGKGYVDGLDGSGGISGGALGQILNGGKAGFLGRAEIGADFENNGFLFGVNGSFGLMNLKQRVEVSDQFDVSVNADGFSGDADGSGDGSLATELKYGNSFTVGARAGFLATPSTLLFAAGGFARQKVKLNADYQASFDGSFNSGGGGESGSFSGSFDISSSESKWANGYYAGGGVEQLFGENTSLRLEYRFTDLGSIKTSRDENFAGFDADVEDASTGVAAEADLRTHAVTATLNFRF